MLCCLAVNTVQAQWFKVSYAEMCFAGTGVDLLDVEICGHAIRLGTLADLSDISLATLHSQRGRAYTGMGDYPLALADFDAALRLNAASAVAYNFRGAVHHEQGEFVRALADFEQAIELSPTFAEAYRNRGVSHFFHGDTVRAVSDFDAAIELNPWDPEPVAFRALAYYQRRMYARAADDFAALQTMDYPYAYLALWRYLAEERARGNAREGLVVAEADLADGEWPQPLIAVYLADAAPDEALAAARQLPEGIRAGRSGEVSFYLAELSLIRGDARRAAELFRATVSAGITDSVEFRMARSRLQQQAN